MSKTLIRDVIALTRDGWRPYAEQPELSVYERLGCEPVLKGRKDRPYWFYRGDVYVCVGCASRCSLTRPQGFPVPLPIRYASTPEEPAYMLSPEEMLARHDRLNVKQAAYCLNVSERTVYDYIAEGRLIRLKGNPIRIRAKEVREMRENFDE